MSLFEKFIKEAFGSQYVIPVYQRNYTWKKNKQVRQLLDDIERILLGETKKHFIGTIVYVIVNTNFIVRERAVVDGQQRLVTMFLIAHALKTISEEKGEDTIAQTITNNYLENATNNKYKYRLQPSVTDDDAYSYIAKNRVSEFEGNSLIMDNYKYLYSELSSLVEKYSLMAVINAVRELYIVRIELDENDDAQQIFESINSTGEKLTAADLIRNFIMMNRTNQEQENIYESYWLKLEKIFPVSKKLAEFFRFYLATKTYTLTTERDLYSVFKIYWKEQISSVPYNEILEDLLNYARHFECLYLNNSSDDLGVALQDYRKLQTFMPAPFMMRIFEHYRVGDITKAQTLSILKLLNTYLIRRYINGQDTSAISRFFPGYLRNVENQIKEENSFDNIVDICTYWLISENKGKAAFMPDDNQIRTYLETANAYALSNIRWVLDKIETHNNPAPVQLSFLSIEHIMPQTQNDYWYSVTNLDEDEYIKVVNLLGNLTLAAIPDNSRMGNNDFDYKKGILDSTKHLKLNAPIVQKTSWTIDDIKKRTSELTEKIIDIFPYIKTSYSAVKHQTNRNITLTAKGVKATGYLNEDNSITVYAGSQVFWKTLPSAETLREKRDELLEADVVELSGGTYKFTQNYTFNSPSTATDFILGGSNNGWLYWKDCNDQVINDSLRIKNRVTNI